MARDKVKRAFVWIRKTLRIIDRTTLPGEVLGEIRTTLDAFGWDRLSPASAGEGAGPVNETAQSPLNGNTASLTAVPVGVMRYIIHASASTNDPLGTGLINLQVRTGDPGAPEIGIDKATVAIVQPMLHGLERSLLLAPGEQLLAVMVPGADVVSRVFIRAKFVDIDLGEYIRPR